MLQPDGEIDRQALGKLVFEDAEARRRLNRATHPAVTCELAKQLLFCFVRLKSLVVSALCTADCRSASEL